MKLEKPTAVTEVSDLLRLPVLGGAPGTGWHGALGTVLARSSHWEALLKTRKKLLEAEWFVLICQTCH